MNIHSRPTWAPSFAPISKNKAPERHNGKTILQVMKRTAMDGHGLSKNKAPERPRCNTTQTVVPQVLENVARERTPHRGIAMEDLPTLHGNAIYFKRLTPRCMGRASAGASAQKCLTGRFIMCPCILSIWIWPYIYIYIYVEYTHKDA